MTSYPKSVDKTEAQMGNGNAVSMVVGTGGVTAGDTLKLSAGTVVKATAKTDVFFGVAAETKSAGEDVKVLRTGCLVNSGTTLTADGYVQIEDGGTGGFEDYTDGVIIGIVETAATSASLVRII